MDLKAVRQFIAVVEEGSLRQAAQRLGVSQPALTKAVRRLEDETGVRLLDRSTSGVRLTAYGEAFLRHGRMLQATFAHASSELRALSSGAAGRVSVGAGPSWHRTLLPRAIILFRADHPQVRVTVRHGEDLGLKAMLREGRLDFVLTALPEPGTDDDLDCRPLIHDPYRLFAKADHPLQRRPGLPLAELLAWPWILPMPGTLIRERLAAIFRAAGLPAPEPALETDILPLRLALMLEGPFITCHAGERLGELTPATARPLVVGTALGGRQAGLVRRRGIEPSPAAQALVNVIGSVCSSIAGSAAAA